MALVDETDTRNMVLRTVFFPPDLDDKLRDVAFSNRVSKGDLIRSLVMNGLASIAPGSLLASHVAKRSAAKKKPAAKKAAKKVAKKPVKAAAKKVAKKPAKRA